jgi:hypothetical protein
MTSALRWLNKGRDICQISTKSVDNHVEKHPLDKLQSSPHAAFNNLLAAQASCELRRQKHAKDA